MLEEASQVMLVEKNLPANAGDIRDVGLVPESGRCPAGRHDNTLQYPCLENPVDRGAWRATVHRVTQSGSRLKQPSTCIHWKVLFLPSSHRLPSPFQQEAIFLCVSLCVCLSVCILPVSDILCYHFFPSSKILDS